MLFSLLFCAVCVGINVSNIIWSVRLKVGCTIITLEALIALICLGFFLAQIHIYMSAT